MKAEELKMGAMVVHTKHGTHYVIIGWDMRMKDSQLGWVDCVAYMPLYENKYACFCREITSFLEEFEVC